MRNYYHNDFLRLRIQHAYRHPLATLNRDEIGLGVTLTADQDKHGQDKHQRSKASLIGKKYAFEMAVSIWRSHASIYYLVPDPSQTVGSSLYPLHLCFSGFY